MKIRELIETLAKCDWDSQVFCASNLDNMVLSDKEQKKNRRRITGISQSTITGTQILFENKKS